METAVLAAVMFMKLCLLKQFDSLDTITGILAIVCLSICVARLKYTAMPSQINVNYVADKIIKLYGYIYIQISIDRRADTDSLCQRTPPFLLA